MCVVIIDVTERHPPPQSVSIQRNFWNVHHHEKVTYYLTLITRLWPIKGYVDQNGPWG